MGARCPRHRSERPWLPHGCPFSTLRPKPGRHAQAEANLQRMRSAAETFRDETGRWPRSIAEMLEPGKENVAWVETHPPRDPWGNDHVYQVAGDRVVVKCLGSDGAEGGDGEAADLVLDGPTSPVTSRTGSSDGVPPKR